MLFRFGFLAVFLVISGAASACPGAGLTDRVDVRSLASGEVRGAGELVCCHDMRVEAERNACLRMYRQQSDR